jgi:hypothetical protein
LNELNIFSKVKLKKKMKKLLPLNSVAVPDSPWRQVGLDLIGPLPETDSGYKYVATMTDYFSKWTEAKALKSNMPWVTVKPSRENQDCNFTRSILFALIRTCH